MARKQLTLFDADRITFDESVELTVQSMNARAKALYTVLKIQKEVNDYAEILNKPKISLINPHEAIRIHELWKADTWPDGWTGEEPRADLPFDQIQLGKYKQLEIHA